MGSSSAETSKLASAEEHKSLTYGNFTAPTCPFNDGVDVKPLNNISHSIGLSYAQTSQMTIEEEHKSLSNGNMASMTFPFSDGVDVRPLNNISHGMELPYAQTSQLAIEKEHKSSSNGNSATMAFPFSDGVDVRPLNDISHGMGLHAQTSQLAMEKEHKSSSNGNLATMTFQFSNGVNVRPLNDHSQSMGLSYAETSQLAMEEEHKSLSNGSLANMTSPFSDGAEFGPSNNISQSMVLSFAETSQLDTPEEHWPLPSGNLETRIPPFSNSVDVRPLNSISISQSMGVSFAEMSQLAAVEEHRPLTSQTLTTPTYLFSDSVDVRPLNNISQNLGLSFAENCHLAAVETDRSLTSGNLSTPTSPFCDGVGVKTLNTISQTAEEHKSLASGNLATPIFPSSIGVDVEPLNRKQSFSSPSTSPLDDLFGGEAHDEAHKPAQTATFFKKRDIDAQECNRSRETHDSGDSLPKYEPTVSSLPSSIPDTEVASHPSVSRVNDAPTTQSPAKQVMERPATSKYRIPSHVFARNKSNAPGEWSVASNESLFSIQMGNSFTTDQVSGRSGYLGAAGDVSLPRQRPNQSSLQSAPSEEAGSISHDFGLNEGDIDTLKEVSRGSEEQSQEKPIAEGRISQYSEESAISTKSFQFPILTDVDKCTSISITCSDGLGAAAQQQTQPHTPTAHKSTEVQPPEPDTSRVTQPQARACWFPCLLRCSLCR